jgi:hypothetical protein
VAFLSVRVLIGCGFALTVAMLSTSSGAADSRTVCSMIGDQQVCNTYTYDAPGPSCAKSDTDLAQVQLLISRLVHDETRALRDAQRAVLGQTSKMSKAQLDEWGRTHTARDEAIRIASEWLARRPSEIAIAEWEKTESPF